MLELPYERGAVDILGGMLRALIVGRLMLPAGGRGTDRAEGAPKGVVPPDLAAGPVDGAENDLPLPCGGRGTLRFMAVCGALRFVIAGLLIPRFDIAAELEVPRLCGGRGTLCPAGCGDLALLSCPPWFAVGAALLRMPGVPVL